MYAKTRISQVVRIGLAALPLGFSVLTQAGTPLISRLSMSPQPRLTIMGDVGVTHQIQCSTNLVLGSWVVLTNLQVGQSPYQFVDASAAPAPARFYRVLQMATNQPPGMMLIPEGSFTMGNCMAANEGFSDELPLHSVFVSAFYMDANLVSKAQWDQVYQWAITNGYSFDHPGLGKAANHPVQTINWYDALKWCNARSEKEGRTPAYYTTAAHSNVYRTGQTNVLNGGVSWTTGYRLPTEAEWEKAARGGTAGHRFTWTDSDTISHSRANYYSNTNIWSFDASTTTGYHPTYATGEMPYTSPVGSFPANGYGLYDMTGNVFQWCWDWYDNSWYDNAVATQDNTRGPAVPSTQRVLRGGDWDYNPFYTRCSYRYDNGSVGPAYAYYGFGFRCVRQF